ncbi:MAG: GNAT family N-acetyltransferase [Lachnospirales bacterium]
MYNKFEKQFPQIIDKSYRYIKLKSEFGIFMDLYVERIAKDKIAIAHTFIQNRDLMRDTEIVFTVDDNEQTINAEVFEQSGFMYQDVNEGDAPNLRLQGDINNFFEEWLKNISLQGFLYHNAIKVIDGEDVEIDFNKSGEEINEIVEDSKTETSIQDEISENETKLIDNELYVGQVIMYLDKEMQIYSINIDSDTIELLDLSISYPIYGVFNLSNVLASYEKIVEEEIIQETENTVQAEEKTNVGETLEIEKIKKFTSDDLKTINESVNAHNHQVDMLLSVYEKDTQSVIGFISYSIYENEVYIQNIEVASIHKRKGLGTYLLQDLANRYYGYDFKFGYTTKEGSLFLEAVTEKQPNQYYEDKKTLLEILKVDIQEMDNRYAENEDYTEQDIEIYYENIAKKY